MKGIFKTMELFENVVLVEPVMNHDASNYIATHFSECVKSVPSTVHIDMREDLVMQVCLSFLEDESRYEGFNPNYGDGAMSVAQYVHSRINKYAKNSQYSGKAMDIKYDSKGNVEYIAKTVSLGNDEDTEDEFSYGYRNAASPEDITAEIEDEMSIREELEFCIDICDMEKFDLITFLKKRENLSLLVGNDKARTGPVAKLSKLAAYHDEMGRCLVDVIVYAKKHFSRFEKLLEQVCVTC